MSADESPTRQPMDAAALFRAYAPFVAAFLSRIGVPSRDLEDAVQEVFIVAHRKGGYLPGPARPRSWLAAIALRIAQAGRRVRGARERREAPTAIGVLDEEPSPGVDPARALETRRAVERVRQALATLPVEHRAAFVLYELEGESCESIAAAEGVPLGTVYSRLHHARRRFIRAHDALSHEPTAARSVPRCAEST